MMETLLQDLRYGFRMLLKKPGFTVVVVLSLALGIGANTAVFSVLDAVLLKLLPVKDPERLVVVAFTTPEWPNVTGTAFSYPMFQDLRDRNQVFSGMLAYASVPVSLNASGRPERVSGQLVSGNFFSVLGVNPLLGRTFSDEDDSKPGAHPVAVLSYKFWKRGLGGDLGLVGKTIHLNSYPFTVVGVAPPEFFGVEIGTAPDVWVPMMMQVQMMPQPEMPPGYSLLSEPGNRWLSIIARLKPGTSEQQARASTELLFRRMSREYLDQIFRQLNREQLRNLPFSRETLEQRIEEQRIQLLPGSKGLSELRRQFSRPLLILTAVVGLVLLVACANIANLLVARTAARQREMAVRLALGAGRLRLARQVLTESILLSGLGGTLGLVVARAGEGFAASDFRIDWHQQAATCPSGQRSQSWRETTNRRGLPEIKIKFARTDCRSCLVREQCTRTAEQRRSLTIQPAAEFKALAAARARTEQPKYQELYALRSGCEGSLSQAVRHCGLRRARYVGLSKTHLQNSVTATAVNLVRLLNWLAEASVGKAPRSAFAKLLCPLPITT